MTVINTNTAATLTANALAKNERAMATSMERLSTGLRINSAGDDAAGLAISSRMTSQINGLNQAVRNANDAISMVQTADGALIEVTSMLQRMREIAVQGASGTNTGTNDMAALNTEYEALRDEVFQIVDDTQWNGATLLDGNVAASTDQTVDFHVGANASQTVTIDFGDFETGSFGTFTAAHDIDAAGEANTAIGIIDTALTTVNSKRAVFGAAINRLEHTADNLANVSQNTSASRSRILDADYASETTELARTQIIQQAGTAMLSQANQQAQSVLALLK
jgi:flagellin